MLFLPRRRGSASRLIAFIAVGLILFFPWAFYPAAAAADDLRVIAVNTASAPHVSMVVEPPAEQSDNTATAETCSVTIDGESVAATVTPMASDSLSVAMVIDTSSDLTAQELAAVQNGAVEFLVRLPQGARVMVISAAGEPRVVAPLSADRAEALSAITALRAGGSRVTTAGAMLAAESLGSAPPGPHAIVVYAHGPDENGPSAQQLSEAALQANAVVNVIPTGTQSIWPSVVDRTGGVVLTPTDAVDIAEAYRRLATMLDEQYVVTFEAPGELPATAQVAFHTGDQEYRTVVNLPDADTEQAAPMESSEGSPARGTPWLLALLIAGLTLAVLGVFARRARRLLPADGGEPSTDMASQVTGAAPPDKAGAASLRPQTDVAGNAPPPKQAASSLPPADKAAPSAPPPPEEAAVPTVSRSDSPAPNEPPQLSPTAPAPSPPARKSLSAAIEGRRLARLVLASQPELPNELAEQRGPANNNQTEDPPANLQSPHPAESRSTASGSEADTKREAGDRRPAEHGSTPAPSIVFTGSGDGIVQLPKNGPRPAAVRIIGNQMSNHLRVRALGTEDVLVVTTRPYDGVRPLDWEAGKSTGFEVTTTGPWRIEVMPLSAMPTFDKSFKGEGDLVIHFTGDGLFPEITPDDNGRIFNVFTLIPNRTYRSILNPNGGWGQIDSGPQFFHVHAAGSWTISIT